MCTSKDFVASTRPMKEVDASQISSSKRTDVSVTGVSESAKVVSMVDSAKVLLIAAFPVVDPAAAIITSEEVEDWVNVNMSEAV